MNKSHYITITWVILPMFCNQPCRVKFILVMNLGESVKRKTALIIFYCSSCFRPLNIKLIRGF